MKIIEITSLGCMSCIVMSDRIEDISKKHQIELKMINSDLEDTSQYGKMDLFPLFVLLDQNNQEHSRFQGEYSLKDLEAKVLECKNAKT